MRKNTITEEERATARYCLDYALKKGAGKCRVTLQKSCMDLIGTLNGETDKVSHCLDRSISLVLFVDGRYGSFSTNRLDPASIEGFVLQAIGTARTLGPDGFRDLPSEERTEKGALNGNELKLYDDKYDEMEASERIRIALDASIFAGVNDIPYTLISEEAEYSDSVFDTLVIDSQGLECRHTETSFEYGVEMTIQDADGEKYSSYWWNATPFLANLKEKEICPEALKRAVEQVGAKDFGSGRYNCVIDRECASRLVTPLLNALNAYSIQQNNSFLRDSLGKKIFAEGLTITDRCRIEGQTGSRLFDSEGVATKEHEIISGGCVNEYFINTYMSNKMGMPPSIEDATRPAVSAWPRKGLDRDALMGICSSGVLVTGFNGGNSNSSTGDFSFGVEGFAFKDGKIVHPVREMLMTGNLVRLWNSLLACGDDARPCMSKLIPSLAFKDIDFSA